MPLRLRTHHATESRAQLRLHVLQQLTASLARARSYASLASVIIDEAKPALDAEVGVVALVSEDGHMLRNIGFKGVDAATEEAWQDYPVESPVPVAEAARTRSVIIVRTLAERNARYPVLAEIHGIENGGPVVALPLCVDAKLLGVLAFCWGQALELNDDDLAFLGTLADQCGLAIERANLLVLAEREIGERKASEAQLREANTRKDEFLAMLAHELRNPLAPIRSAADLLAAAKLEGPLASVPDVLGRQVAHMSRIVDDLLDVSRIARGRVTLALDTIDLVELVRSTVTDHTPSFVAAGVELTVRLAEEPLWIRGDATRMSQAVANLLHNAVKFTRRGRSVTVTLLREKPADATAVLEIRDEGIGIRPELIDRLFTPFAQGDSTLARSSGGLGLGLAIVHGLVTLHGGGITAASDGEGKGATFRLSMPLASAPSASADDRSASTRRSRARNVLIVEDNADAAEMLALVVTTLGHLARVTHSAEDALTVLEEWSPHVILSDLGLPDLDGFQLAQRIRSQEGVGAPLLVALSGYGSPEDKARARAAGFHHHVTKPIDASTLAGLLDGGHE